MILVMIIIKLFISGEKKMKLDGLDELQQFNFSEDIDMMTEVFDVSRDELFKLIGISDIRNKTNIDQLYDFCYNNGFYINDIKWQEYRELFDGISEDVFCHGSRSGIKGEINLSISTNMNDFGQGFYLGQTIKQAGMFVSESENSSIYLFKFDMNNLSKVVFNTEVDWMLAISYYRDLLPQYKDHKRIKNIIDKIDKCDFVIAPIADNRIFELVDAFANNMLTDKQTMHALSATYLGYQYVLKSNKALSQLEVLDRCYLCPIERSNYNHANDIESNTSLNKARLAKYRYKNQGLYIDDILS